jgi:class 3 adenylate cyclase/TM2 domain-containing membrane protein YozV
MKEIKRRLAAIMFTDIVGYSAMMQRDELIARRLRDRHREVFKTVTLSHGGEILQYYGDGTLSIFPSATAAVECAVELQRELKKEPAIPLRIGIHTGDVNYDEEDVFGDGVNVASRIEGLCIPGGVYLSGKVYDDIKNHPKIKARSLGRHTLKNIAQPVEVYAVSNMGVTAPAQEPVLQKMAPQPVVSAPPVLQQIKTTGKKKKSTAGWLALLFGIFGAHLFYLGIRKRAMFYLGFSLAAMTIFDNMLDKFIPALAIACFVEGIIFWAMSKEEFDEKYNAVEAKPTTVKDIAANYAPKAEKPAHLARFEEFKLKAQQEYREYDLKEAISWLKKAAEIKNDDPDIHFMLAQCYSLDEEAEKAILHLDAAVGFGLEDIEKINKHDDLAYLRMQPLFQSFKENDYRLPAEPLFPKAEPAESSIDLEPDLLEQLNKLQRLRNDGVLNEEEYQRLKAAARF